MGLYKKLQDYKGSSKGKTNWKPEYKKFRVKSSIKSFRDLEVYRQTTQLSVEIFQLELPATIKNRKKISGEIEILYDLSKNVPRLIAESYGDKFTGFSAALQKLEKTAQIISNIITKIDFIVASIEHQEIKETLNKAFRYIQIASPSFLGLAMTCSLNYCSFQTGRSTPKCRYEKTSLRGTARRSRSRTEAICKTAT